MVQRRGTGSIPGWEQRSHMPQGVNKRKKKKHLEALPLCQALFKAFQIVTPLIKGKETGSQRQGHIPENSSHFNTLKRFPHSPQTSAEPPREAWSLARKIH